MILQRILISMVAVMFFTVLLWHARAHADNPGQYQSPTLRKAEWALQQGHPERTLALLQGRDVELRRWREEAQGRELACRAYFELGDFGNAERACDEAVLAGSGYNPGYRYRRGVMRLLQGRVEEGIADLRSTASLPPVDENLAIVKGF